MLRIWAIPSGASFGVHHASSTPFDVPQSEMVMLFGLALTARKSRKYHYFTIDEQPPLVARHLLQLAD